MDYKSEGDIGYSRRQSPRIEYYSKICCKKALVKDEEFEFEEPLELIVINVSERGFGVLSAKHFDVGTILSLNIVLEEVEYEKISARVIWEIKKGDMYRLGLLIINISGRLFSHMSKFNNSISVDV